VAPQLEPADVNPAANPPKREQPRRVLVVEDDAPLAAALVFDLEAEGYAATTAASGEAALAAPLDADCLVVDYVLPGIDGLTLIARLRQRGVATPAILITSDPDARLRDRASAIGAEIVEKPLIGRRLQARIAALTGR
jgi:DNA-binding response OmpR family regulator